MDVSIQIIPKKKKKRFFDDFIFLAQMEVDCENHVPFYGILPNENLTLLNKTEDDTEVLNIRGKDKNNKSYVRTLEVKFVENKRVELHELIRYENSETDFLNENYLILFKTTL